MGKKESFGANDKLVLKEVIDNYLVKTNKSTVEYIDFTYEHLVAAAKVAKIKKFSLDKMTRFITNLRYLFDEHEYKQLINEIYKAETYEDVEKILFGNDKKKEIEKLLIVSAYGNLPKVLYLAKEKVTLWGDIYEYNPVLILRNGTNIVWLYTIDQRPFGWYLTITDEELELWKMSEEYENELLERLVQTVEETCGTFSDEKEYEEALENDEQIYPRIWWEGGGLEYIEDIKLYIYDNYTPDIGKIEYISSNMKK